MREHFNDFKGSLVCELKYLPADLVVFVLTGGLVHELWW